MPFFAGLLPVQCGGGRRPGSLADATQDCSTSEDFLSPRTLLTENICESVQQILQHSRAENKNKTKTINSPNMPFFTGALPDIARQKQTKNKQKNVQLTKHDAFLYWSSSCPMCWWATARNLDGCYSGLFHFGGLLA